MCNRERILFSAIEPTLLIEWRFMTYGRFYANEQQKLLFFILATLGFYLHPIAGCIDAPSDGRPLIFTVINAWADRNEAVKLVLTDPNILIYMAEKYQIAISPSVEILTFIVRSQGLLPSSFSYAPLLFSIEHQQILGRLYGISYARYLRRRWLSSSVRSKEEFKIIVLSNITKAKRLGGALVNPYPRVHFNIAPTLTNNSTIANRLSALTGATYMRTQSTYDGFCRVLTRLAASSTNDQPSRARHTYGGWKVSINTLQECGDCGTRYYRAAHVANVCQIRSFVKSNYPNASEAKSQVHAVSRLIEILSTRSCSNPIESMFGNGITRPGCRQLWLPDTNKLFVPLSIAVLISENMFARHSLEVAIHLLSSRISIGDLFEEIIEGIKNKSILAQWEFILRDAYMFGSDDDIPPFAVNVIPIKHSSASLLSLINSLEGKID